MKDVNGEIQYGGKTYKLVFNINVMEAIQAEYGTLDKWGELTDGTVSGEVDAKALKFGIREMLNEGIEIENEENGTDFKPLTLKQVGRMLTSVGLEHATTVMNETFIKSTESNEKNG